MRNTETTAVPFYIWPLAGIAGIAVAAGSLSYAPQGRINVLWVWLLWAGLPLLGSLASLVFALFGSARPWLFHWRNRAFQWYPTPQQRLHMLWLLQAVWCVLGLGMLVGYWALLLFSDLAFGWSSTLVQNPALAQRAAESLALPWQTLWPKAVPSAEVIVATHFQRIAPTATEPALAGAWWRFLMASLLVYNLLPRVLLALVFYVRWRWYQQPQIRVHNASPQDSRKPTQATLVEDSPEHWRDATLLSWELEDPAATAVFGLQSWQHDEKRLHGVLAQGPQKLLWQVKASRSPVEELSDLMSQVRQQGIGHQAIVAKADAETDPERHLASWQAFARRHQLVWITHGDTHDT